MADVLSVEGQNGFTKGISHNDNIKIEPHLVGKRRKYNLGTHIWFVDHEKW